MSLGTWSHIRFERKGSAAWILLDRPEKRNALSPQMLRDLGEAIERALADEGARSIVITGRGSAFCAGADLELGRELAAAPSPNPFAAQLEKLQSSPKPVIAAVGGPAFGGGVGLVAAADIAIASTDAIFSFSEVRLGLIPAMISIFVLPKIGPHHARRLFTTGRRFTAEQAQAYGLLHRVTEPSELEDAVLEECADIALGGPEAVAEAKRLVFEIPPLDLDEAIAETSRRFARSIAGEEGQEGTAAFRKKRAPSWVKS